MKIEIRNPDISIPSRRVGVSYLTYLSHRTHLIKKYLYKNGKLKFRLILYCFMEKEMNCDQ